MKRRPADSNPLPLAVTRRFEAVVFDWDGTAVTDRAADASSVRCLVERLCGAGIDVFVVSGTHVGNIDGQLAARTAGPGRLYLCLNRGSEVFEVDGESCDLIYRREATASEDAALTTAAESVVQELADRGLRSEIVSQRLNRRKIDLIPEPDWLDPPKARIGELLEAVTARLDRFGIAGLPEIVHIAQAAARDAGLSTPRVTSDVKHVEIGLTDKSDSARWVSADLWNHGISPEGVLIGGDEFGSLGGVAGSDSLMLVAELDGAVALSVGVEPEGVPSGVMNLGGGPPRFVEILTHQVVARENGALPIVAADPGWSIVVEGFDAERERADEVRLTLADGFIASAGVPPASHPATARHVYASGFFTGTGSATELAECPAWMLLPFDLTDEMTLRRVLDMRTGVLGTELETAEGTLETCAFSSLARPGTAALRAQGGEQFFAGGTALTDGKRQHAVEDALEWIRTKGNKADITAAAIERKRAAGIERYAAYVRNDPSRAAAYVGEAASAGFDLLLAEHRAKWASRWDTADIKIEGDPRMQRAVRFALFHQMAQVADFGEAAVGARGLSGPAYRGHVFWDADVFTLPFLAATHPASARAMLEYRIRRLPAAMEAARRRGRKGARFPWESADDGFDVTPTSARDHAGNIIPIRTAENEEHIVADVAWAADCYVRWSGDEDFARGPGCRLWIETARYWASRIRRHESRSHIFGVTGPDEYHESVDDNAYTNVMARWNLRRAARAAVAEIDEAERRSWLDLADDLVDGYDSETQLYEQFAGFHGLEPIVIAEMAVARPVAADLVLGRQRLNNAQTIKQADVLMLHLLVSEEVATGSLAPNLDYYEPRTSHGSTLSPGTHATLFAQAGRPDDGYRLFELAATIDLDDVTHATAGGLHFAAMGTVWQAVALGYAGLRPEGDTLHIEPHLPSHWDALEVRVSFRGVPVRVNIEETAVHVWSKSPIRFEVHR